VVARLDEPMFDLNEKVTAQMLRDREIAIHGSKQYVIDTIMKMRTECGYNDFCFLGWFELGGFAPQETSSSPARLRGAWQTSLNSMLRNSPRRHALVWDREVLMRKMRFSERRTAFILTKAAAACPRGGTTCCPIVPEAPGLATGLPTAS
jgi:hypothetical protein